MGTIYTDTHAHFEGTPLETVAVMERAFAAGVTRVVAVGGSASLNAGALATALAFPDNVPEPKTASRRVRCVRRG